MSDTELMKKLLDGTLNPVELDNNPHLYVLAERIYGREALEEMGVIGPKVVWLDGMTWDGLHEIDTWKEPGSIEIFDISLIVLFSLMTLIGLFFKKRVSTS